MISRAPQVIVLPGTTFRVDAVIALGGNLTEVRMREVRGTSIEAGLAPRHLDTAAVGRRRLPPVPGGDTAIARMYTDAGVDPVYGEP